MKKYSRLVLWLVFFFAGVGVLKVLDSFLPGHHWVALAILLVIAIPLDRFFRRV